jgi:hypothetical protein
MFVVEKWKEGRGPNYSIEKGTSSRTAESTLNVCLLEKWGKRRDPNYFVLGSSFEECLATLS